MSTRHAGRRRPPDPRAVRASIKAAPKAEETISYGFPAFRLNGKVLACFRGASAHCSYHPMSGRIVAANRAALGGYETSTGTVRFPIGAPPPARIVRLLGKPGSRRWRRRRRRSRRRGGLARNLADLRQVERLRRDAKATGGSAPAAGTSRPRAHRIPFTVSRRIDGSSKSPGCPSVEEDAGPVVFTRPGDRLHGRELVRLGRLVRVDAASVEQQRRRPLQRHHVIQPRPPRTA